MRTTRLTLILALLATVITSCHTKQPSGFETLSESEKNHQWLLSRGYKVLTPQEYLADADSALSVERSAGNYLSMSLAHWYMGNTRSSLAYADSALTLAGDDAELNTRIQYRRASAYGTLGDREKERAAYKAIIDWGIDEDVRSAMESIALSYFLYGNYKEALTALPDSLSPEGKRYKQLILDAMGHEPMRIWKPVLSSRYVYAVPSDTETDSWARGLQVANPVDSIGREQIAAYGSARRYLAVHDFYQAWYGKYRSQYKNNHRITEWRLLQYDTSVFVERSARKKVLHLKVLYEDILDFEAKTAEDVAIKEQLTDSFTRFFDYTMDHVNPF